MGRGPEEWEGSFVDLFAQGAHDGYARSCLWITRNLMDRSGSGTERYPAFCCEGGGKEGLKV